jgi:hypothetical protein
MHPFARILLPVALLATTVGAVAGYSFHARPAAPVYACNPTIVPIRVSETANTEAGSAMTWRQQPSLMDSSWKRWPSLTDF